MKPLMRMLTLVLCLGGAAAHAENAAPAKTPSPAQQAQQERMKRCNQEAKSQALKGDERKAFMKECLSGKATAAAPATQRDKMKLCNQKASEEGLKGDARKAFMSECLKN